MNKIKKYYDREALHEWARYDRHPIEFEITFRCLEKHITPRSRVLDLGGGPGRYSIYLAEQGHDVWLFDLSPKCLELAKQKASEHNVKLAELAAGTALDLSRYKNNYFDVVLCMGPLYHLLTESDRYTAVKEALRVLKSGGLLFCSFITQQAPLIDLFKKTPEELIGKESQYLRYLEDGINVESPDNPGFTDAYFADPASIPLFMSQFDLEQLDIYGLETILSSSEPKLKALDEAVFQAWLDILITFANRQETWGCCEHLLYIGRKRG